MTIASEEWDAVVEVLEECFPGEWTERKSRAWRLALADQFSAVAILAAIRQVAAGGEKFRPSLGEILSALTRSPAVPTFAEAFDAIFEYRPRSLRVLGTDDDDEAIARAEAFHPWLGAFVERQIGRLRTLPVYDPDWGEKRRDDLRREYDDFVRSCEERNAHGVAIELTGRRGALAPFEPLAALGLAQRPRLAAGKTTP